MYADCPALYKHRYVDRIFDPPTIDMEYGQAIHTGLDAHFKGGDGELAFIRDLKQRLEKLIARGADPADWLVPQGIRLMAEVGRLGWSGESEQKFHWVCSGFTVPFIGVIDLWSPDRGVIVDWKTTQRAWSNKTPDRYQFQRAIYWQSTVERWQRMVTFQFVALGAYPGGRVQVIDATPQPEEVVGVLEKARAIAASIEREDWLCTCGKHQEQAA